MNDKELLLTPRELYCLGGVLNAKYIDYAYIAALDDIGQDYQLFQKETLASLSAKEILIEDFGGNTEMNEEYIPLLEPIFFGTVETSLDVCNVGDPVTVDVYKFHFYQDRITMVMAQENSLLVKPVSVDDIMALIEELPIQCCSAESGTFAENFDPQEVSRVIAAKSVDVGLSSKVLTLFEFEGAFYTEQEEGKLLSLSQEDFASKVFDVIKGAM